MTNCWFCGIELIAPVPGDYVSVADWQTREHLIPKSKGGGEGENVVDACMLCKVTKSGKTVGEYRVFLRDRSPQGRALNHLRKALGCHFAMRQEAKGMLLKVVQEIEKELKPIVFAGEREKSA